MKLAIFCAMHLISHAADAIGMVPALKRAVKVPVAAKSKKKTHADCMKTTKKMKSLSIKGRNVGNDFG
jgi:hypothetical protein